MTTTIAGQVVTRWTTDKSDSFEIGTFGRGPLLTIDQAEAELLPKMQIVCPNSAETFTVIAGARLCPLCGAFCLTPEEIEAGMVLQGADDVNRPIFGR